jgi:MinD-like ATPase involved in chromosome partitioning or flagellar assembly
MGGGKGGIGKTFFTANLAAVAARAGRRVIGIDADLGGANLHTALGVRGGARVNLGDFLEDRVVDLERVAVETSIPGLRLILGALGNAGETITTSQQRVALVRAIRCLEADLVVLDLSSGIERSTLDLFVAADSSFVVTTPEPTAVENAYAFLRAAFYRRMGQALRDLADRRSGARPDEQAQRARHPLSGRLARRDRPRRPRRGCPLPRRGRGVPSATADQPGAQQRCREARLLDA